MDHVSEKILSNIIVKTLRTGVVLSMTITVIGLVKYLLTSNNNRLNFSDFVTDYGFAFKTFREGLSHFDSISIMLLGVLALMLTPIARIFFSVIGFALIKDRLYVVVGTVTLTVIALSIIIGLFF